MTKRYFVLLSGQKGQAVPMTDGPDDELATFDTIGEAEDAAERTIFGKHFGYSIFDREDPVSR